MHRRGLRQGDQLSPMLFILVMDVLYYLVKRALEEGLLQPLARRNLQHRISLYADDVVIFLQPSVSDISITLDILQLFGEASGLKTNVQKCTVSPSIVWRNIELLCRHIFPVKKLNSLANTTECRFHCTNLPRLRFNPSLKNLLTSCLAGRLICSPKLVE